jgi:hypothetical protein
MPSIAERIASRAASESVTETRPPSLIQSSSGSIFGGSGFGPEGFGEVEYQADALEVRGSFDVCVAAVLEAAHGSRFGCRVLASLLRLIGRVATVEESREQSADAKACDDAEHDLKPMHVLGRMSDDGCTHYAASTLSIPTYGESSSSTGTRSRTRTVLPAPRWMSSPGLIGTAWVASPASLPSS